MSVTLEGHTDQFGSDSYNMMLGKKRANRVKKALIAIGVEPERIAEVKSFGKKRLKCGRRNEACHKENRRVVMRFKQSE